VTKPEKWFFLECRDVGESRKTALTKYAQTVEKMTNFREANKGTIIK